MTFLSIYSGKRRINLVETDPGLQDFMLLNSEDLLSCPSPLPDGAPATYRRVFSVTSKVKSNTATGYYPRYGRAWQADTAGSRRDKLPDS